MSSSADNNNHKKQQNLHNIINSDAIVEVIGQQISQPQQQPQHQQSSSMSSLHSIRIAEDNLQVAACNNNIGQAVNTIKTKNNNNNDNQRLTNPSQPLKTTAFKSSPMLIIKPSTTVHLLKQSSIGQQQAMMVNNQQQQGEEHNNNNNNNPNVVSQKVVAISPQSSKKLELQQQQQSSPHQPQLNKNNSSHPQPKGPKSLTTKRENPPAQQSQSVITTGGGRKKSQKKSQVSNFIYKTYKILQVLLSSAICRIKTINILFIGQIKEVVLLSKTKTCLRIIFCLNISNIESFLPLQGSLICMIFTKLERRKRFLYLSISKCMCVRFCRFFRKDRIELLHKIKRKSGDDAKEGSGNNVQEQGQFYHNNSAGFLPSIADITQKQPAQSLNSLKSKSMFPSANYLAGGAAGNSVNNNSVNNNNTSDLDRLLQENQQLSTSISELTNELSLIELNRQKKKEKIVKIMSALAYFDFRGVSVLNEEMLLEEEELGDARNDVKTTSQQTAYSLRDIQNHVASDEQPLSFSEYAESINNIYRHLKKNIKKFDLSKQ